MILKLEIQTEKILFGIIKILFIVKYSDISQNILYLDKPKTGSHSFSFSSEITNLTCIVSTTHLRFCGLCDLEYLRWTVLMVYVIESQNIVTEIQNHYVCTYLSSMVLTVWK